MIDRDFIYKYIYMILKDNSTELNGLHNGQDAPVWIQSHNGGRNDYQIWWSSPMGLLTSQPIVIVFLAPLPTNCTQVKLTHTYTYNKNKNNTYEIYIYHLWCQIQDYNRFNSKNCPTFRFILYVEDFNLYPTSNRMG